MTIFTHPQGAAFEDISLPPPPRLEEGEEGQFLVDVDKYLKALFMTWGDLEVSIRQGWIIKDARVVSISADKVIANSIFTQDLFVGADQNIRILGSTDRIEVWDKQATPKLRIILGKISATSDDWGIEVRDSGGTVRFKTGTATFIDGAIITNATITNAKIVDATITGGKVASNTITDGNISDVSFGKLTAGIITTTGVAKFSGGADIEMKAASSGDTNYIRFLTSGGTVRGFITYMPSFLGAEVFSISGESVPLLLTGTSIIVGQTLRPSSSSNNLGTSTTEWGTLFVNNITAGGSTITYTGIQSYLGAVTIQNTLTTRNVSVAADSTYNIGTNTVRYANIYCDTIHRTSEADVPFRNAFVLTEPDRVYQGADKDAGLYFMYRTKQLTKRQWEWYPVAFLDKHGVVHCSGIVHNATFTKPDFNCDLEWVN